MDTTELIDRDVDDWENPQLAVCYAYGTFKKEGPLYLVEVGKRRAASRALCMVRYFGDTCDICPNSQATLTFRRTDALG